MVSVIHNGENYIISLSLGRWLHVYWVVPADMDELSTAKLTCAERYTPSRCRLETDICDGKYAKAH